MDWKKLLAYINGSVYQEPLLRNEYLVTENRILLNQINGRVRLTDGERKTLADLAKKLGKKALEEVANIVKPDTLLGWYRRLIANKFDGTVKLTGVETSGCPVNCCPLHGIRHTLPRAKPGRRDLVALDGGEPATGDVRRERGFGRVHARSRIVAPVQET
jgi:hypothetical protein